MFALIPRVIKTCMNRNINKQFAILNEYLHYNDCGDLFYFRDFFFAFVLKENYWIFNIQTIRFFDLGTVYNFCNRRNIFTRRKTQTIV